MPLQAGNRAEQRKKLYKAGVDVDSERRRREGSLVEIRKTKREDDLTKKRRVAVHEASSALASSLEDVRFANLQSLVQGVWAEDPSIQLEATTKFKELISIANGLPIEKAIESGIVPRFVEFLSWHDMPQLQFEAAWALTNIAAGTSKQTQVVIEHGAVPKLIELLCSPNDDIRQQAVWALVNVASDSPSCRDIVLSHGALLPIIALLNERSSASMLKLATRALCTLCLGKPSASFEKIKPSIQVLRHLIFSCDDEILRDSCCAFASLSNGTNDEIQSIIETGVCCRLVELLLHPSPISVPALRTIGNIVTGSSAQTQHIIDEGLLPCLFQLLTQSDEKCIKRDACWTISNITAGNNAQIQAVIDANIITPLVQLLQNAEFDIKKEAAWAISNATCHGSNEQIRYLVSQGSIKPLCDLLICPDPAVQSVCLHGLESILKVGQIEADLGKCEANSYAQIIEECEGLDKIESLQDHDNEMIYHQAIKILERYWVEEPDALNALGCSTTD